MSAHVIDAYTHCGLDKYEPIDRVREMMTHSGIDRAVLAQHLGQYDNRYIGSVVSEDPEHFAGVCHLDAASPSAVEDLVKLSDTKLFRGLRLLSGSLHSAPELWRRALELGFVIVAYAPNGIAADVDALKGLLDVNLGRRVVLTHLGNPTAGDGVAGKEYRRVFDLAAYSGVYFQVSGMKMFCPYPHTELYPLVAEVFDRFGASRLMWGSNYPVVGDEADVKKDLNLLLEGRLPIPDSAIRDVAYNNACKLWFS